MTIKEGVPKVKFASTIRIDIWEGICGLSASKKKMKTKIIEELLITGLKKEGISIK